MFLTLAQKQQNVRKHYGWVICSDQLVSYTNYINKTRFIPNNYLFCTSFKRSTEN